MEVTTQVGSVTTHSQWQDKFPITNALLQKYKTGSITTTPAQKFHLLLTFPGATYETEVATQVGSIPTHSQWQDKFPITNTSLQKYKTGYTTTPPAWKFHLLLTFPVTTHQIEVATQVGSVPTQSPRNYHMQNKFPVTNTLLQK